MNLQLNTLTHFQIRTNALPRGSRLLFRSRSPKLDAAGNAVTDKKGDIVFRTAQYRRPLAKTVKGSRDIRFAKRQKITAMKEAGHLRGDNRPFEAKI